MENGAIEINNQHKESIKEVNLKYKQGDDGKYGYVDANGEFNPIGNSDPALEHLKQFIYRIGSNIKEELEEAFFNVVPQNTVIYSLDEDQYDETGQMVVNPVWFTGYDFKNDCFVWFRGTKFIFRDKRLYAMQLIDEDSDELDNNCNWTSSKYIAFIEFYPYNYDAISTLMCCFEKGWHCTLDEADDLDLVRYADEDEDYDEDYSDDEENDLLTDKNNLNMEKIQIDPIDMEYLKSLTVEYEEWDEEDEDEDSYYEVGYKVGDHFSDKEIQATLDDDETDIDWLKEESQTPEEFYGNLVQALVQHDIVFSLKYIKVTNQEGHVIKEESWDRDFWR